MSEESTAHNLGRRGLLVGAGTAVAGGLVAAGIGPASAAPVRPAGDGTRATPGGPGKSSPITSTIASAPTSGAVYRFVDMYDFNPFDDTAVRTWGGQGVYTAVTATALRASVDIPPGATVRDIEYYVSNSSGSGASCSAYVHVPGSGFIWGIGADASVPSGDGSIVAVKVVPTQAGPYPFGARLLIGVTTPTDGSVQVNGGRAAFSRSGGQVDVFGNPIRAYDSRTTGGRFAANETRTIRLTSGVVPPGCSGIIANITATGSTAAGSLTVFAGGATLPPTPTVNFQAGETISNEIIVSVSAARQIQIEASAAVHAVVDVVAVIG